MKQRFLQGHQVIQLLAFFSLIALSACGKPWVPTGGWQAVITPTCESIHLERALSNPALSTAEQIDVLRDYMRRCQKDITREARHSYAELFRMSGIQYDYMKLRAAESVDWISLDGVKV